MFWPFLYVMENLAGLLGNMSEGLMNLPDGPCLWSNLLFNFSVVFPSCCNLICIRAVHSSLCSPFSTCVPTHGQLFSNSVFFFKFHLKSDHTYPIHMCTVFTDYALKPERICLKMLLNYSWLNTFLYISFLFSIFHFPWVSIKMNVAMIAIQIHLFLNWLPVYI